MRPFKPYNLLIALLLMASSFNTSCISTKVVANNHCDTFVNNEHYQTNNWSYLWGLVKKDVYVGKDCNDCPYGTCNEETLNAVDTRTTFGGTMLSVITLGIVNHQQVKWCCSRPNDGDGGLDN